jgi:hypothetical protein
MSPKPNMTVTSRFLDERGRVAARQVPSPFPDPPPNRGPIGRLAFHGPSPKLEWTTADLVHAIGVASLQDAVFFLDTNVLTKQLEVAVWDALCTRRIMITPGVWKELLPWLKTPFCNKTIRDSVVAAIQKQVSQAGKTQDSTHLQPLPSLDIPKMEVLFLDEDFTAHGYEYYLKLLSLRKCMGPVAAAVLTKKLGRVPTHDEYLAEVQGNFGERGFRMAKKGSQAADSPNKLTDEQLVIMAALTAIMKGSEVFIVTRDADVLEQCFKLVCLMKEHYRAMLAAEQYAANPGVMAFRQVPVVNDGVHIPEFASTSVLEFQTTDVEFNPLPPKFHFVNIYCVLLGGEPSRMRVTLFAFCAETEMAQMLRIKASTEGLNTDKFDGRNCIIRTTPLAPEHHRVIVSIGQETMLSVGPFGKVGLNDLSNTLFCNEVHTRLFWDDPDRIHLR